MVITSSAMKNRKYLNPSFAATACQNKVNPGKIIGRVLGLYPLYILSSLFSQISSPERTPITGMFLFPGCLSTADASLTLNEAFLSESASWLSQGAS